MEYWGSVQRQTLSTFWQPRSHFSESKNRVTFAILFGAEDTSLWDITVGKMLSVLPYAKTDHINHRRKHTHTLWEMLINNRKLSAFSLISRTLSGPAVLHTHTHT